MTKPVVEALVLVALATAVLLAVFFTPPSPDLGYAAKQDEQSGTAGAYSGTPLPPGSPGVLQSQAVRSMSRTNVEADISESVDSALGLETLIRSARPNSANLDEEAGLSVISGQVQDEEGYPLATIEVLAEPIGPAGVDLSGEDGGAGDLRSARTNRNGSFTFENMTDGEYRIRTAPIDGYEAAVTTARASVTPVMLVLAKRRDIRVHGVVNSAQGSPLEGVQIIAGPPTRATTSGPNGEYELDVSVKGSHQAPTMHFRHPAFRDQSIRIEPADLADMFDFRQDVQMEPLTGLTTVAGVLSDTSGRAVAGKIINFRSPGLRTRYRAQSDQRGRFTVDNVESGPDYHLTVRPGDDYRDFELKPLEIPGSGQQLDLVLEPLDGGALSGWMTDAEGKRISGFAMTLQSKEAVGRSVQVVGDQDGYFSVRDFPEGRAVLRTSSYPVFEVQGIRISAESEESLAVVLDTGRHQLFGQVTTRFGDIVAAAEVSLGWQLSEAGVQNYSVRKFTTDHQGLFAFTGLGPGVHILRVNAPGFGMAVFQVDVGVESDFVTVELEESS